MCFTDSHREALLGAVKQKRTCADVLDGTLRTVSETVTEALAAEIASKEEQKKEHAAAQAATTDSGKK
jgi:hypothetical protein